MVTTRYLYIIGLITSALFFTLNGKSNNLTTVHAKDSIDGDSSYIRCLCGTSQKYWDASSGYSWLIKCDSTATAFAYNYEKKKVYIKFNERVVVKNVPIKFKHDTLIIQLYRDYSEAYKIISLSDNKMELVDLNTPNKNIIRYSLSLDQSTMPIEAPLLNPDTSTWPVKIIKTDYFKEIDDD